jgi:prepilin-type N-terminal cleavage/methylation domain-containing protein
MKNNKGFTLIELLAVTVILALIIIATVPNLLGSLKRTKEKEYVNLVEKIKQASVTYVEEKAQELPFLKVEKDYIYTDIQKLVDMGLLDEKIKDPRNNNLIDLKSKIRIEKAKAHSYIVDVFVDTTKYTTEKNLYDYKTNIYNLITADFSSRKIVDVVSCGTNCININFSDKTAKQLFVEPSNNRITYSGVVYNAVNGSTISSSITLTNVISNNIGTLSIVIPITHSTYVGNYGISISKTYNTYSRNKMVMWLDGYDAHQAGVWYDKSGNNYNGTLTNMAGTATSGYDSVNKAYAFAGDNDYIDVVDLPASIDWSNGYTIEFVVKWNALNTWSRIMDFGSGAPSDNIVIANESTSIANIRFDTYNTTTNTVACPTVDVTGCIQLDNTIDTGLIANYQFVVNSSGVTTVYKNGDKVSNAINSAVIRNVLRQNVYIGRSNWGTDSYFNGSIYSFRIYNRVLTTDELNYNYKLDKEKYIQ